MVLISFDYHQKIHNFSKFGGCGSKIEPATPISILNFKGVRQGQIWSHNPQILKTCVFFKDKEMVVISFVHLYEINNFPKCCGCTSKIGPSTPIQSSKLKWAWQAQFLSHTCKNLQNCFFLKDLQMILIPFIEIFDRFPSTKKLAGLHLHVNQDLLG